MTNPFEETLNEMVEKARAMSDGEVDSVICELLRDLVTVEALELRDAYIKRGEEPFRACMRFAALGCDVVNRMNERVLGKLLATDSTIKIPNIIAGITLGNAEFIVAKVDDPRPYAIRFDAPDGKQSMARGVFHAWVTVIVNGRPWLVIDPSAVMLADLAELQGIPCEIEKPQAYVETVSTDQSMELRLGAACHKPSAALAMEHMRLVQQGTAQNRADVVDPPKYVH